MVGRAAERVAAIQVERGLYVLRYCPTAAVGDNPEIFVRASPGCDRDVELITVPGSEDGCLREPGTNIVVRATRSARLQVTLKARHVGGSTEARLRLEPLGDEGAQDDAVPSQPAGRDTSERYASGSDGLRLICHVARRGDVEAGAGEWVAGPDAPAPIEGLEIQDSGTATTEGLQYQVLTGVGVREWSSWNWPGTFAGSRGKSRPLFGIRLRSGSDGPELQAEALFLGSAVVRKAGRTIELVSGSGMDPLVGLRLSFRHIADARIIKPELTREPPSESAGRVRVFRASTTRTNA